MADRGHTLLELIAAMTIFLALSFFGLPQLRAYAAEVHILGAGTKFKMQFRKAHSMAVRSNVYTAIRFESQPDGMYYSLYADGNMNGVLSVDIASGRDPRIAGPYRLDAGAPGVRVGINPGVPEIPPERGTLDTSDPIRFGRSNMLSFSPLGTATPGTFYLAGPWAQGAVRVTPQTARVRLMIYRGRAWRER